MSATTSHRHRPEQNTEESAAQAPQAPQTDTSAAALDTATQGETPATVTADIAGTQAALPLKFAPGHALTETQARILDAAYQRQFTNNQNALHKSAVTKLEAAKTEEEKAAAQKAVDAFTPEELVRRYTTYEPQVGGGPRLGSMEKMRLDAAWRAYVKGVKEHNADLTIVDGKVVGGGDNPVFAKAKGKVVTQMSPPRKTKDISEEAHKAALEEYGTKREAFLRNMLTLPAYAERIQIELDAIMAEKGKPEAETADAVEATADVL